MSKKKKKQKSSGSSAKSLQRKLDKIVELWDEDAEEAFNQIEALALGNPNFDEAWQVYAEIATEQEFLPAAFVAHYHLFELDDEDEERVHNFALLCGALAMPFSALYYSKRYHDLIGDSMINRLDEVIANFEPLVADLRLENPDIADIDTQYMAGIEISERLLTLTLFDEARKICISLMEAIPNDPIPRNNLALIYMLEGDYDKAYALQEETLKLFPDNIFAHCDFAQLLTRLGRDEEAEAIYAPVRQNPSMRLQIWFKRFETLAMMGKDAEIVENYQSPAVQALDFSAYGLHLIATAHARTGDEETAKKLWRKAKKDDPSLDFARENLLNLDLLADDKQDAWYFELNRWVSDSLLLEVETQFKKDNKKQALEKLLQSKPELQAVLPILLDRGDIIGREFALDILRQCPSPILVDFMNSNKGTTQNRVTAAYIAYQNDYLPKDQPIKMQIYGVLQELHLITYDIFTDPIDHGLSKHLKKLITKVHTLLNDDKSYQTALEIVQYARTIDPNERTLMNYHAMALTALSKDDEAMEIILETLEKHPDYIFPQMDLARKKILDEDYEGAQQLIDKWSKPQRMHASEFLTYVVTNIEMLIAQKKHAKAKCWLYQAQAMAPHVENKLNMYHGMITFMAIPKDALSSLVDAFSGE